MPGQVVRLLLSPVVLSLCCVCPKTRWNTLSSHTVVATLQGARGVGGTYGGPVEEPPEPSMCRGERVGMFFTGGEPNGALHW